MNCAKMVFPEFIGCLLSLSSESMAAGQSGIQIEKSYIDCKTIYIHTLTDRSPTNVGTVVITAIIELILSATWNPYYFRHGLPIFRRMYSVVPTFPKPSTQELEAQFRGQFRHPILFRKLSPSEYAFRYSFFHFGLSATPLMHGMLRWDDTSGLVSVTGYANWFPTCFVLLVAFVWSGLDHVFLLFTIIIVALSLFYLFQSKRFNKVGELASQAWQNHLPKAAG